MRKATLWTAMQVPRLGSGLSIEDLKPIATKVSNTAIYGVRLSTLCQRFAETQPLHPGQEDCEAKSFLPLLLVVVQLEPKQRLHACAAPSVCVLTGCAGLRVNRGPPCDLLAVIGIGGHGPRERGPMSKNRNAH